MKAGLYVAYAVARAWRERHPFSPALAFLTTTKKRAATFLRALGSALSDQAGFRDATLAAGAGSVAFSPERMLREPVLLDLHGEERLTLPELLDAARVPYERERAAREAERWEREQSRRRLLAEPEALRAFLQEHEWSRRSYFGRCGEAGERALRLLLAGERKARSHGSPTITASASLPMYASSPMITARDRRCAALGSAWRPGNCSWTSSLKRSQGGRTATSMGATTSASAAALISSCASARPGALARQGGPLRRLAAARSELYPLVDEPWLRVCTRCGEIAYPSAEEERSGQPAESGRRCPYCGGIAYQPFDPDDAAGIDAAGGEEVGR